MKRLTLWFMVTAMALLSANSLALAQTQPLRPVVTYNVRMPSTGIATEFELVHLVQDFAPGATSSVHTHGGQGLALVLEGEITQIMEGQPDKVYKAGETFLETPGVYFAVANKGSVPARLSVQFLLPRGETLTTPRPPSGTPTATPPPPPVVTYNVRMASPAIPGEFELVHLVQDFAPGAASPVHTHGGQGLALVLAGEITQIMEGQPDKVYRPGETFLEIPGVHFAVANKGSVPARLSVGFLLPKGETLTTVQQTATPTATVAQPTATVIPPTATVAQPTMTTVPPTVPSVPTATSAPVSIPTAAPLAPVAPITMPQEPVGMPRTGGNDGDVGGAWAWVTLLALALVGLGSVAKRKLAAQR